MVFSSKLITIRTPLHQTHELQVHRLVYHKRAPNAFENLLVSKDFFAEATETLFETAAFTFSDAFGGPCRAKARSKYSGDSVCKWSPLEHVDLTMPISLSTLRFLQPLRRIQRSQIHRRDLPHLQGLVNDSGMQPRRVVLKHCSPYDLGLTNDDSRHIVKLGPALCAHQWLNRPVCENDLSEILVSLETLRDVYIIQDICWLCTSRGAFCKARFVQMHLELGVLRAVLALRLAQDEKEQVAGQIRALRMNIEMREKTWARWSPRHLHQ